MRFDLTWNVVNRILEYVLIPGSFQSNDVMRSIEIESLEV